MEDYFFAEGCDLTRGDDDPFAAFILPRGRSLEALQSDCDVGIYLIIDCGPERFENCLQSCMSTQRRVCCEARDWECRRCSGDFAHVAQVMGERTVDGIWLIQSIAELRMLSLRVL